MVKVFLLVGGLLATLVAALVAGLLLAQLAPTHDRSRRQRLRAQGLDVLPEPQPGWKRRLLAARARSRGLPPEA